MLTLLATGGTIACTPGRNGLEPTLGAADLLRVLGPAAPSPVRARDVFTLDSSNVQPEEWRTLARAAHEALKTSGGVVINSLDPADPLYREDLVKSLYAVGSVF